MQDNLNEHLGRESRKRG